MMEEVFSFLFGMFFGMAFWSIIPIAFGESTVPLLAWVNSCHIVRRLRGGFSWQRKGEMMDTPTDLIKWIEENTDAAAIPCPLAFCESRQ